MARSIFPSSLYRVPREFWKSWDFGLLFIALVIRSRAMSNFPAWWAIIPNECRADGLSGWLFSTWRYSFSARESLPLLWWRLAVLIISFIAGTWSITSLLFFDKGQYDGIVFWG